MTERAMGAQPLVELRDISKRFSSRMDLASRIAARIGAGPGQQVVRALDSVSPGVSEAARGRFVRCFHPGSAASASEP